MDTVLDIETSVAQHAIRSLNEVNTDERYTYRLARVRLDAAPPIGTLIEVNASDLGGARVPDPPDAGPSPDDVYVPPEERGVPERRGSGVPGVVAVRDGGIDVRGVAIPAEPVATEEIGEHVFEDGTNECAGCGCSMETAYARRRCGA